LDGIIAEIDEDGSGTIDFDGKTWLLYLLVLFMFGSNLYIILIFILNSEFMEMMTGE
jgi:hypothetical protein